MPVLHSIESEVIKLYDEFPNFVDKDVEWVYDKLNAYYKALARGKQIGEPLSTSERKQALVDELLNKIDLRAESGADDSIIGVEKHGSRLIDSREVLYEIAFKSLLGSARFWRKKDGKTGYLDFISGTVIG